MFNIANYLKREPKCDIVIRTNPEDKEWDEIDKKYARQLIILFIVVILCAFLLIAMLYFGQESISSR